MRLCLRGKSPGTAPTVQRSFAEAWRRYIRGQVVSRHAQRLIVQFLAACCGKSRRTEAEDEDKALHSRKCPANEVQLSKLHALMDDLGEGGAAMAPKPSKVSARGQKKKGDEEDCDHDDGDEEAKRAQDNLRVARQA